MSKKNHSKFYAGQMATLAIAIQDGNYIEKTNTEEIVTERSNIVPQPHAFANSFLKVNYMFWVNQKSYFEEDVVPCLTK